MKLTVQILTALLLMVSSSLLAVSAQQLNVVSTRVDRLEEKVGGHCENFSIHKTN